MCYFSLLSHYLMASFSQVTLVCVWRHVVVVVAAVPLLHLTESQGGGGVRGRGRRRRRGQRRGGCHGNWESVAARHHSLLYSAERSTLIFQPHGHRQTIKKKKISWWNLWWKPQKKDGGQENRGGWMGRKRGGEWQSDSILSGAEGVCLHLRLMWTRELREMQSRRWEQENKEGDGRREGVWRAMRALN